MYGRLTSGWPGSKGSTDPIINAIRNRTAPDGLTGDDAAVVRFTKELLTTHEIADTTFDSMQRMLGNKGIMDLILLIMYYHSLAHTLQAVRLEMPPVPHPHCERGTGGGYSQATPGTWVSSQSPYVQV